MHLIHTGCSTSSAYTVISETEQLLANHSSSSPTYLRSLSTVRYIILPRLWTVFWPKAWNALPDWFHTVESTDYFFNQLKTLLVYDFMYTIY